MDPELLKLLLQVVRRHGRGRVGILRDGGDGDDPRRAQRLLYLVLHVVGGEDGQRSTSFFALVGFNVLRQVVAPHESLATFRTLESLLTWKAQWHFLVFFFSRADTQICTNDMLIKIKGGGKKSTLFQV